MTIRNAPVQTEDVAREELARTWRCCGKLGFTDTVFNHISIRLKAPHLCFLMNIYDQLAVDATAGGLSLVDRDSGGEIPSVRAGVLLHNAIYTARQGVNAIIHLHSAAATAVSALQCGLLPLTQAAMEFIEDVAYVDFAGVIDDEVEAVRITNALGRKSTAFLRNHGLLAVGNSIAEVFYLSYYMEMACGFQLRVFATGQEYVVPSDAECRTAGEQLRRQRSVFAPLMWAAMCGS